MEGLLAGESDFIANMANLSAVLQESFSFHWTGFYLMKDGELVLGPFQGPVACTRIAIGSGVCGTAMKKEEVIIVDDVEEFPGHIACSPYSKSEIVLPLIKEGKKIGVLDIDSDQLSTFDEVDRESLLKVVELLLKHSKI